MPAKDERRELVPVTIATIVAAVGVLCLWSDLRNDPLDQGDGMITSAVVLRAGATKCAGGSDLAIVAPHTVLASEPSKVSSLTPP